MESLLEVLPVKRSLAKPTMSPRVFSVCYLVAIIVATIGWLSAFGWFAVSIARWLSV